MNDPAPPELKKTALCQTHIDAGAKMVDFGGWFMPVQYSGILQEHEAVRKHAGLFDISHMGQLTISGPNSKNDLNHLLTNQLSKPGYGEGQYSLMLNENGGVIDDLLIYALEENSYFLVINASMIAEDLSWIRAHVSADTTVNFHNGSSAVALQGPESAKILQKFLGHSAELPTRYCLRDFPEKNVRVARTGYTGEDGFEIFSPAEIATQVWHAILALDTQCLPCGLGARDTLRLEKCYPLNGSDLSARRTPAESGLMFFVDREKPDFIGKRPLLSAIEHGISEKLVAFVMTQKSPPPRAHYPICDADGTVIGEVSSGSQSPSLGIGIGMGYVKTAFANSGTPLLIDVRGRKFPAEIRKKPLYSG